MQLRTDGVHCRESAGTGPEVKEVPLTCDAFSGITMDHFLGASLFLAPTVGTVDMLTILGYT